MTGDDMSPAERDAAILAISQEGTDIAERAAKYGRSEAAQLADDLMPYLPADEPGDDDDISMLAAIPTYPVDALPQRFRAFVQTQSVGGLPAALLAGAGLGAIAAAIGGNACIEVYPGRRERAILWPVLIAPRGSGKSPAMGAALAAIRERDAELTDDPDDEENAPRPVLAGDCTMEAIARLLKQADGSLALDIDELSQLLRGLGEYKGGGGGDRGRALSLWEGSPLNFIRVGSGGKTNAIDLRIKTPTMVIVGGLQPELHGLLGDEADGMRPRWLPHLAGKPSAAAFNRRPEPIPADWNDLFYTLLHARHVERTWTLDSRALDRWKHHQLRWKTEAEKPIPAGISAALDKADRHCCRVALVLAETMDPGRGGPIGADIIDRAAQVVEFTIDSWRAMPEHGNGLGLSRRDQVLSQAVQRLVAYLDAHGGQATRRELLRGHAAGVRKAAELDALLTEYEQVYPGSVTIETPAQGGRPTTVVRSPRRAPTAPKPSGAYPVSPVATPICAPDVTPHGYAKNGGSGGGDTEHGDTGLATPNQDPHDLATNAPENTATASARPHCGTCGRTLIARRDRGDLHCPACEIRKSNADRDAAA